MAEAKSKTRSGKEFRKENEDQDLEEFAPMMEEKDSSKKREQERTEEKERYEREEEEEDDDEEDRAKVEKTVAYTVFSAKSEGRRTIRFRMGHDSTSKQHDIC